LLNRALSPVMSAPSGSGSLGFFTALVKQFGADRLLARTAGTIYGPAGSSEIAI